VKGLLLPCVLALTASTGVAQTKPDDAANKTMVYGGSGTEGWAFWVSAPPGWKFDCCDIAKRHNANLLVFREGWDGSDPEGAMVLTVWPKKLASAEAELEAGAKDYEARFPGMKTQAFSAQAKDATCRSVVYVADQFRDYVVFCEPGTDWHYRFGWSLLLNGAHADQSKIEAAFRQVISSTTPMRSKIEESAH